MAYRIKKRGGACRVNACLITLVLGLALYLVFTIGLEEKTLRFLQAYHFMFDHAAETYPVVLRVCFVLLFVLFTGLYLPGGLLFIVMTGALFPLGMALAVASLANAAGAVIGFLLARVWFQETVARRFPEQVATVNRALERYGIFYLFLLRLAPVMPSPAVNAAMGLSAMPIGTYAWVTLLGRVPMTALYVSLGAELGRIRSLSDLLSPQLAALLSALCLLALAGHTLARKLAKGKT